MMVRVSSAEARAQALERSRDRIEAESAARLHALDAAHQAEVQVLESRIAELSDTLTGAGKGYAAPGFGGPSGTQLPPGAATELRLRLKSLEALNRQLESELDAARRRAEAAELSLEGARAAAASADQRASRATEAATAKAKADRDTTLER